MIPKRWILQRQETERAASLSRALGVSPVVAALLLARGCADELSARAFLHPSSDQLHDPYLMLGMKEAVARLLAAIDKAEPILVYGDYDVDGTTGTAVLLRALKLLGAQTGFHVPHRFTEGYGIQQTALEKAVGEGYKLALSVDCGIRAHEPLHWARENALDVIITDHHLPDDQEGVPPAYAVLNPNQGLKDLAQAKNPGLRALMEIAGCGDGSTMSAYDLGFRIGPRINAAGRMDAARAVVELFDTRDRDEARRLAEHLDCRNQERKKVQQEIFELAIAELENGGEMSYSHVAVIAGEGWHRGVIGIAASKISERINRPCVVLSLDGDIAHGSGRSIQPYHLLNGLTACSDLFDKFGGHSHAAGITIKRCRIAELRRRLNEHAASCLTKEDLEPTLYIDAELPAEVITFQLIRDLNALEPFGAGNPRPVFLTRNLRILAEPRVMKERHLKMYLAGERGRPIETIWWNCLEHLQQTPTLNARIELAYTIETNTWNGEVRMQLNVEDMKVVSGQ